MKYKILVSGVIGVPVTVLEHRGEYKIIGNEYDLNISKGRGYINGKRMYSRIFIKLLTNKS